MGFWEEFLPALFKGVQTTLSMLAIAAPASVALGIVLGTARVYGGRIASLLATAVVVTFRGFPLLVTLLVLFFGLADLHIYLTPFWAAVLGFILCSGSYQSEYVRGAIRSIDIGQSLAARALGMTKMQEVLYIILPQAIRRALPGISNEIIYMIKYSSLAFVVGVQEMFAVAKTFNSLWFRPIEIFMTLAFIYLAMTTAATFFFKWLENKLRIPGIEMGV
ncbi:MAG TPA: amino acid ABC transporter permease [Acidilobales archaeon]|nr:MAG: amino acid ABC transporter permease [Thermoprotei archaeon]HDD26645.1 amino acid ABC transporter permease [Acidilobales archaeon]